MRYRERSHAFTNNIAQDVVMCILISVVDGLRVTLVHVKPYPEA